MSAAVRLKFVGNKEKGEPQNGCHKKTKGQISQI